MVIAPGQMMRSRVSLLPLLLLQLRRSLIVMMVLMMSLLVVMVMMIPRSLADLMSFTEHRGASIALFFLGVLMPKGERAIA